MDTAIDLFAGYGGNSEGAELAGLRVLWAANHNKQAVYYYRLNHPSVNAKCQDLRQQNWTLLPEHWLGMASPCCQGHTNARGKDRPHHDESRMSAFAVVDYLECNRPPVFLNENVPEFQRWPLFSFWRGAIEALGYSLTLVVRDAADHGIPQHRVRLFIVGVRDRHPLPLRFTDRPHRPVREIIDWDGGRWSKVDKPGRSPKTLARVKRGREQFGDTIVMPYYSNGSGLTGRSIDRPLGTVTTRERWAIVRGDEMRMFTRHEYRRAMSFDDNAELPASNRDACLLLGNATCPVQVADVIGAIRRLY